MASARPKVPPPLIGIAIAVAMWVVAQLAPVPSLVLPFRGVVAGLFAGFGFFIDAVSVLAFFSARTTINPLAPQRTERLVTVGMFRYSRNPMYLGMLLMLCGWALWLAQPLNVVFPALFVWIINRSQIRPEELVLAEKFGDDYQQYCQAVRRWV
ncbi:MAG: isoprenylcysteine carboxylmethyltransferase family protein [Gammaproteobacteria bacterium]